MTTESRMLNVAAATAVVSAAIIGQAAPLNEFIASIRSPDDKVRGPAWQSAEKMGSEAVKPLGEVMATSEDPEVTRAARRGLWRIVRHSGRPNAEEERRAVQNALMALLSSSKPAVKREVLWMLSEIGDAQAVAPMAALLKDSELREDARQSLLRIPGEASLAALKKAAQGTGNVVPPILEAVRVYATIGEISDTLRQVFGEYRER